jgi:probable rRNA maturation factor
MDISLHIDEAYAAQINAETIEQAIIVTLQLAEADPVLIQEGSVALTITDNEIVQQLNLQYLGIDAPTDVLSFENVPDADFPEVETGMSRHLGDIVIAYPVAEAQAASAGHAPMAEVTLLTVHGALHLLGFDHDTPERKEAMWAVQQQIMARLGLAHVQPTEETHGDQPD